MTPAAMTPEQQAAQEAGRKFQRELDALVAQHLTGATLYAQTSIFAVLLAEATRGACLSRMPLDAVLQAVTEMYAIDAERSEPRE